MRKRNSLPPPAREARIQNRGEAGFLRMAAGHSWDAGKRVRASSPAPEQSRTFRIGRSAFLLWKSMAKLAMCRVQRHGYSIKSAWAGPARMHRNGMSSSFFLYSWRTQAHEVFCLTWLQTVLRGRKRDVQLNMKTPVPSAAGQRGPAYKGKQRGGRYSITRVLWS